MSGTTTTTTTAPQYLQGAYFYDNIPQVAAALDLQNAVLNAANLLSQVSNTALANTPTSKVGLPVGTIWNNGGVLSVVMP